MADRKLAHRNFIARWTQDGVEKTMTITSGVGTRLEEIRGSVALHAGLKTTDGITVTKGPRT